MLQYKLSMPVLRIPGKLNVELVVFYDVPTEVSDNSYNKRSVELYNDSYGAGMRVTNYPTLLFTFESRSIDRKLWEKIYLNHYSLSFLLRQMKVFYSRYCKYMPQLYKDFDPHMGKTSGLLTNQREYMVTCRSFELPNKAQTTISIKPSYDSDNDFAMQNVGIGIFVNKGTQLFLPVNSYLALIDSLSSVNMLQLGLDLLLAFDERLEKGLLPTKEGEVSGGISLVKEEDIPMESHTRVPIKESSGIFDEL